MAEVDADQRGARRAGQLGGAQQRPVTAEDNDKLCALGGLGPAGTTVAPTHSSAGTSASVTRTATPAAVSRSMTCLALRRALSLPVCASTSIVRFDSAIGCNLPCRRERASAATASEPV